MKKVIEKMSERDRPMRILNYALNNAERQYVKDLMTFTAGDIKKDFQLSGLSRTRLYVLLKKHNLSTRF